MGFLPELTECVACGRSLEGSARFWHALADGLTCADDKRLASSELSPESRKIAAQMLRSRVSEFAGIDWPKPVCADLRKFLIQILERHIEKKLVTAGMLEKIRRFSSSCECSCLRQTRGLGFRLRNQAICSN